MTAIGDRGYWANGFVRANTFAARALSRLVWTTVNQGMVELVASAFVVDSGSPAAPEKVTQG